MKIAATVGVALLAFGALASPAWAQEDTTTLSVESTWYWQGVALEPGSLLTYRAIVTNVGDNEAEGVGFAAEFVYDNTGLPSSVSASTTAYRDFGNCDLYNAPDEVLCDLGDLDPGENATITISLKTPPSPGWSAGEIRSLAVAWADNAPRAYYPDEYQVGPAPGLPGGGGPPPNDTPKNMQECKKGGYEGFGFRNQGLCIKAVNHPDKTVYAINSVSTRGR